MNHVRTKKPIALPSHLHIKHFLDSRAAAGRQTKNVAGKERTTLMRDVWPLFIQRQWDKYETIDSPLDYKWMTETWRPFASM